ncbi:MAG: protocatechuate 3,4-dioxygenase [Opitutaceae bacterium]
MKSEKNISRRKFLTTGAAAGLGSASVVFGTDRSEKHQHPTPTDIEGPFYPIVAQKDKDFDLTQVEGHSDQAKGHPVFIIGSVQDPNGNPIEGATVDLWQANAAGRYKHPHDPNPAPLDPNFQGWAIVQSGKDGAFRFKTIIPGAYPASEGWMRPPHIHFKVSMRGYVELTTQLYFPGQKLNDIDRLLQSKSPEEQKLMIAEMISSDPETYRYRIVIKKA